MTGLLLCGVRPRGRAASDGLVPAAAVVAGPSRRLVAPRFRIEPRDGVPIA